MTLAADIRRNPARTLAVVGALIGLATAFGLDLTVEQHGAINALFVILIGESVRGKVSPIEEIRPG